MCIIARDVCPFLHGCHVMYLSNCMDPTWRMCGLQTPCGVYPFLIESTSRSSHVQ